MTKFGVLNAKTKWLHFPITKEIAPSSLYSSFLLHQLDISALRLGLSVLRFQLRHAHGGLTKRASHTLGGQAWSKMHCRHNHDCLGVTPNQKCSRHTSISPRCYPILSYVRMRTDTSATLWIGNVVCTVQVQSMRHVFASQIRARHSALGAQARSGTPCTGPAAPTKYLYKYASMTGEMPLVPFQMLLRLCSLAVAVETFSVLCQPLPHTVTTTMRLNAPSFYSDDRKCNV